MSIKLSICIPTFERAKHLNNCLNSILLAKKAHGFEYEICISDNGSTDNTEVIVKDYIDKLPIKYSKNSNNLGIPRNFLKVVSIANGEFAWLLGDDDLLMPDVFLQIANLFERNQTCDFFYINSNHLTTEYVFNHNQPFDTKNLPITMIPVSKYKVTGPLPFIDLINPKISFDFLGGMFHSIFKRKNWVNNQDILDSEAIEDMNTFSHFDNTFPHVKIFSKAFANSNAYFLAKPLSVCLSGAREWSPMYPFVHSVRLVEALDEYRKNGLPFIKYLWCRNFALNSFIPDFVSMYIFRDVSGFKYIKPLKLILNNCIFPNFYFSIIFYLKRKIRNFISKF